MSIINSITKNEQRKKRILLFLINLMALFPLICFICPHYSTVSYELANNYPRHILDFLGSMRYFGAFIIKCWTSFFDPIANPCIDVIVYLLLTAFITSCLSIFIQNKIQTKSKIAFFLIDISVLISFCNVWINDILTFPECIFLLSIGNIFCCLALIVFFSEDIKRLFRYLFAGICLVLATAVYQQYLVIFIIFAITLVDAAIINNETITKKETVFKYVELAVFGFVSESIYFIIGKLIHVIYNITPNSRISVTAADVLNHFKYYLLHQHSFLKGRGFFQTEALTICYGIVIVVWIFAFIYYIKKKKKIFQAIIIFGSYLLAYSSAFILGLLSTSTGTRTMLGLFSVFGLFAIGSIVMLNKKSLCFFLSVLLTFVYILNMFKTVDMSVYQYKTNTLELTYANLYFNEIIQNEKKNNNKIKKIEYCMDSNCDMLNQGMSAMSDPDYFKGIMLYVSEREFEVSEITDNHIKEKFSVNDWKYYNSSQQMQFYGDTLYLCFF